MYGKVQENLTVPFLRDLILKLGTAAPKNSVKLGGL